MKPSFLTLVGLLAASVAANPLPASNSAALVVRGGGKNTNNANGAGCDAGNAEGAGNAGDQKAGKGKQNGKQNGQNGKQNGKQNGNKGGAGAGAGGAAQKNGTANAGGAAAGGAGAGAGNATAGAIVLPDGRIKADAVPEDFNVLGSVFKSAVVKGDGLLFSNVITFPDVESSIFDKATNTKAFAINIDDKSVFIPQGGEAQSNIRRADLLPSIRSQLNDVAVTGVRTLHFSVQRDPAKPLNATHDYQIVNLESKDFSFHQIDVRTGADNGNEIAVFGNSKTTPAPQKIFSAPFGEGQFENFALKMDFNAKYGFLYLRPQGRDLTDSIDSTVQVFHSTGQAPLQQATEPIANDLAGLGEYHFALQKNAVGDAPQPTGIQEALFFAGIFMEDSTDGTVTLQ
ncbi:hypothetical protein CT0861_12327 [Colletotrichum tofieldiae]|uniref:Glycoside hydrolase 131 catalytic N-terminal domain-containing protein n=1 Tax=Colletotrichum tofieldiae TaxID=708197 RepID=A0A166SIM0_9PEZI|nr:hypothetical protein CT0861_12327 [Colletotrichum tofieldiae]GKT93517.1 hypothetical protein Ct61P_11367 [Colletotrichum tofieldiae]